MQREYTIDMSKFNGNKGRDFWIDIGLHQIGLGVRSYWGYNAWNIEINLLFISIYYGSYKLSKKNNKHLTERNIESKVLAVIHTYDETAESKLSRIWQILGRKA